MISEFLATNTFGTRNYWLGMNRNSVGGFQWTDGSAVTYEHWAPNEPSYEWGGNVEDCLEQYDTGLWNDQVCGNKRPFMCKIHRAMENCQGIANLDKDPCGYPGITEDECISAMMCCWNPYETIPCFKPGVKKRF